MCIYVCAEQPQQDQDLKKINKNDEKKAFGKTPSTHTHRGLTDLTACIICVKNLTRNYNKVIAKRIYREKKKLTHFHW